MNCPKCGAKMSRAGLTGLSGEDIVEQWVCGSCGHRIEKKREKPTPYF